MVSCNEGIFNMLIIPGRAVETHHHTAWHRQSGAVQAKSFARPALVTVADMRRAQFLPHQHREFPLRAGQKKSESPERLAFRPAIRTLWISPRVPSR